MESAFGASFDDVTIHTGGEADALTRQVDAVAFTHGSDIYFSDGAYAPETSHGQRLLAHELTHVVQQHSARKVTVGAAYDPAESEADAVADAVVQRLQAAEPATPVAPATVARQAQPEEDEEKPNGCNASLRTRRMRLSGCNAGLRTRKMRLSGCNVSPRTRKMSECSACVGKRRRTDWCSHSGARRL